MKPAAREISRPVIGDRYEPTELCRHRDERHGIEPAPSTATSVSV
jgi:hypothetical protein